MDAVVHLAALVMSFGDTPYDLNNYKVVTPVPLARTFVHPLCLGLLHDAHSFHSLPVIVSMNLDILSYHSTHTIEYGTSFITFSVSTSIIIMN